MTQLDHFRIFYRDWRGGVTPAELSVLLFVYDRTRGWSKKRERITIDQLEHGVWSDDRLIARPTELSKPTLISILNRLTDDTYRDQNGRTPLKREAKMPRHVYYTIDFDCTLPIPKRLKPATDGKESLLERSKNFTRLGKKSLPDTVKKVALKSDRTKSEEKKRDNYEVEKLSGESISEVFDRLSRKTDEKRNKKAEKGLNPGSTIHDLNALWKAEILTRYPKTPVYPWTAQERGMVAQARKKWLEAGNAKSSFGEFLAWSINHWESALFVRFPSKGSSRYIPSKPAIRFFVKYIQDFIEGFHSGEVSELVKENSRTALESRKAEVTAEKEKLAKLRKETEQATKELEAARVYQRMARHRKDAPTSGDKPKGEPWKPDPKKKPVSFKKYKHLFD